MVKNDYIVYQKLEENPGYVEVYNTFFDLLSNDEDKRLLYEIMFNGTYKGKLLGTTLHQRDGNAISIERTISYAYMLVCSRKTMDYVADNNITLFHGTNSNALSIIVRKGLQTAESLEESNIDLVSGEKRFMSDDQSRDFISLTDVPHVAFDYSILGNKRDGTFPVVIATSDEVARKKGTYYIGSDLPEVGVAKTIQPEDIKAILVPSSKVMYVKAIANGIKVLPLEIDKRFYYIESENYIYSIIEEKLEKFKDRDMSYGIKSIMFFLQNLDKVRGEVVGKSK